MMRKTMLLAAVALLAAVIGVQAGAKAPADTFSDEGFVKMAAIDGMHEIELGKIAQATTKNDDVKKFAEKLVKDHSKSHEDLKAAAKFANIAMPEKIDEQHQKHIDTFKNYKGTNFDKDFIKHEVTDHTDAVALYTRASKEAKQKDLKNYAIATLPVLQQHLDMAKKLDK